MFSRMSEKIKTFQDLNKDKQLEQIEQATKYTLQCELAPIVSISFEKCLSEQVVG